MTDTARYVEIQVRSNEILQKFTSDQDWRRAQTAHEATTLNSRAEPRETDDYIEILKTHTTQKYSCMS